MTRLILARLAFSTITLLIVSLIIFWAVELLPGDAATRILGRDASPERVKLLRIELGLDDPAAIRYVNWLKTFVQGDWGISLVARRPVLVHLLPRLNNTLILAAFALALYVPLSLLLGSLTAVFRGRGLDNWLSIMTLIGMSVPEFVVGIFLIVLFAVALPWFPPLALIDSVKTFPDLLHTLALPAITLTAAMTAYAVRMMRDSLIEVLESDYVRMAILKGMPKAMVLWKHALPNALGPALNVTALNIAWLIGGVVVVETVFNFPGLGRMLIDSVAYRDSPVILAIALIMAAVYILANLLADLLIAVFNPRLRHT